MARGPRFDSDHWMQAAYERVAAGEDVDAVLFDYGFVRLPPSARAKRKRPGYKGPWGVPWQVFGNGVPVAREGPGP